MDKYIQYWAHMLDEAFSENVILEKTADSFFDIYCQEKRIQPNSRKLMDEFVKKFSDFTMSNGDIIDGLAGENNLPEKIAKAQEKLKYKSGMWDLIPARIYKAIISRSRDVATGKMSHGVGEKQIRECLEKICYNYCLLATNRLLIKPMLSGASKSKQNEASEIWKGSDVFKALRQKFDQKIHSDFFVQTICFKLYAAWAAFDYDPTGGGFKYIADTDGKFLKILHDNLSSVRYDIDSDQMVPLISKCVDLAHNRGSLAAAFVEGGVDTCVAVSNMKPDELYERIKR